MILRNGFAPVTAANVDKTRVQWRIQDPNQKTPWVQQFSLGPEYQIGAATVVGLDYVGNLTRNGRKLRNLNQGIITGSTVTFPYAQYGFANAYLEQIATDGEANYHSLQARVQRRLSRGLSFTTSFTYGRALGNFLDHLSADGGGESGNFPKNVYDLAADYGPLSIDIRKRFVTSFIYELPLGAGRAKEPRGVLGALARDWNVNGILTLSDGRPFSITSTDRVGAGPGRISRANCSGDPVPSNFDQTIDHWFDTTAFSEPAALDLRQLHAELGGRAGIEVDEPVAVPVDPVGRAPHRAAGRVVQHVQLGKLRAPRPERVEPGHVRANLDDAGRPEGAAVRGEVLFLTRCQGVGRRG